MQLMRQEYYLMPIYLVIFKNGYHVGSKHSNTYHLRSNSRNYIYNSLVNRRFIDEQTFQLPNLLQLFYNHIFPAEVLYNTDSTDTFGH
jgi:hypothetical protein